MHAWCLPVCLHACMQACMESAYMPHCCLRPAACTLVLGSCKTHAIHPQAPGAALAMYKVMWSGYNSNYPDDYFDSIGTDVDVLAGIEQVSTHSTDCYSPDCYSPVTCKAVGVTNGAQTSPSQRAALQRCAALAQHVLAVQPPQARTRVTKTTASAHTPFFTGDYRRRRHPQSEPG